MTQWHGGKGSKPRPYNISQEEYDKRWDAIFGRDESEEDEYTETDEDENADTDEE